MEIKISTKQTLKVMQVLSWVIFIGLCIDAGALIVNTFIVLVFNPAGVENYWENSDYLSKLLSYDQGHFLAITLMLVIVAVLKAIMFYFIVKLFTEKQLNISQPFSPALLGFITRLSYLSLGIGLFSHWCTSYASWLSKQGLEKMDPDALDVEGAAVWLFMSVILYVIVQVVKRGVEIQNENDLTI